MEIDPSSFNGLSDVQTLAICGSIIVLAISVLLSNLWAKKTDNGKYELLDKVSGRLSEKLIEVKAITNLIHQGQEGVVRMAQHIEKMADSVDENTDRIYERLKKTQMHGTLASKFLNEQIACTREFSDAVAAFHEIKNELNALCIKLKDFNREA